MNPLALCDAPQSLETFVIAHKPGFFVHYNAFFHDTSRLHKESIRNGTDKYYRRRFSFFCHRKDDGYRTNPTHTEISLFDGEESPDAEHHRDRNIHRFVPSGIY